MQRIWILFLFRTPYFFSDRTAVEASNSFPWDEGETALHLQLYDLLKLIHLQKGDTEKTLPTFPRVFAAVWDANELQTERTDPWYDHLELMQLIWQRAARSFTHAKSTIFMN